MIAVQDARDPEAALRRLRGVEPYAVDGATAEQMAAGCMLLDVVEDGREVGAVAVEVRGRTASITAAWSEGEYTAVEYRLIEAGLRAMGVRRVELVTCRLGLIRNMQREGFGIAECRMTKEI